MSNHKNINRIEIILICLCWYATSSIASQITKKILTQCPFPLLLGEFQFLFLILAAITTSTTAFHFKRFKNLFPAGTFPKHFDNDMSDVFKLYKDDWIIRRPSKHIVKTVLPLGIFQFVGKWFGHKATAMVPISTVSSIKTTSPFFIIVVQRLLQIKTKNNKLTLISLSLIILGVLGIVKSDSKKFAKLNKAAKNKAGIIHESDNNDHHNSKFIGGLLASTVSMLVFVFQNIYAKKIFTNESSKPENRQHRSNSDASLPTSDDIDIPNTGHRRKLSVGLPVYNSSQMLYHSRKPSFTNENSEKLISPNQLNDAKNKKYDKMTLMIYISFFGFIGSLGWFLFLELPTLIKGKKVIHYNNMVVDDIDIVIPWNLFALNGLLHFIQALITYYLLGKLQTLSYSVANLMKRIVIIVVSWLMMTDGQVGFLQMSGLILNIIGLYLYNVSKL